MERRGRLPGADELFRQTGPRPTSPPEPTPVTEGFDPLVLADLTEQAAVEDSAMAAARGRGAQVPLPSPPVGALIAWVAASRQARSAVEVGSAVGLTGLWVLRGMHPKGVLTSIEPDPHIQGLTEQTFTDAGANDRVRSILGDPLDVLPRLSDHGYDLVLIQRITNDHRALLSHGLRLLRPGGVLIARSIAAGSGQDLRERRAFVQGLTEDDRVVSAVLPLDAGVVVATQPTDDV